MNHSYPNGHEMAYSLDLEMLVRAAQMQAPERPVSRELVSDVNCRSRETEPEATTRGRGREHSHDRCAAPAVRFKSLALTGLFVWRSLHMYFMRAMLLPLVLALLLSISHSACGLARIRIRPPVGAAIILLSLIGLVGLRSFSPGGTRPPLD